jgi:hypothetical protein
LIRHALDLVAPQAVERELGEMRAGPPRQYDLRPER